MGERAGFFSFLCIKRILYGVTQVSLVSHLGRACRLFIIGDDDDGDHDA